MLKKVRDYKCRDIMPLKVSVPYQLLSKNNSSSSIYANPTEEIICKEMNRI